MSTMNITNSNVAVTGGAGFVGSHLVDRLLARGNSVLVVDDFSTGSTDNLVHHEDNPNLNIKAADVRDEEYLCELFRHVDFVFHLATRNVRLSLAQPTLVHDVNVNGTYAVLKAAAACKVKRLLYCSSSEVNGTADIVPMPETYHYRPETIYGASKLMGEYYAQVFHKSNWLPTVIARPHNNYGPREHFAGNKGEVIPRFILWALSGQPLVIYGAGRQTRDFTYVTETADYLVRLLECNDALGQTFNVCRGEEVSIVEIAELVRELTQSSSHVDYRPARPNDVLRLFGDPTRLRKLLGSSPRISIREGLARTIAWFREHIELSPNVLQSLDPASWQKAATEPWMNQPRPLLRRTA
jgi:UDP-glucose 4-epimerase